MVYWYQLNIDDKPEGSPGLFWFCLNKIIKINPTFNKLPDVAVRILPHAFWMSFYMIYVNSIRNMILLNQFSKIWISRFYNQFLFIYVCHNGKSQIFHIWRNLIDFEHAEHMLHEDGFWILMFNFEHVYSEMTAIWENFWQKFDFLIAMCLFAGHKSKWLWMLRKRNICYNTLRIDYI